MMKQFRQPDSQKVNIRASMTEITCLLMAFVNVADKGFLFITLNAPFSLGLLESIKVYSSKKYTTEQEQNPASKHELSVPEAMIRQIGIRARTIRKSNAVLRRSRPRTNSYQSESSCVPVPSVLKKLILPLRKLTDKYFSELPFHHIIMGETWCRIRFQMARIERGRRGSDGLARIMSDSVWKISCQRRTKEVSLSAESNDRKSVL